MRKKLTRAKDPIEKPVRDIRRKTGKYYSVEEKTHFVPVIQRDGQRLFL